MDGSTLQYLGAGIACIGAIGGAIGVGNIFSSLISGIARNPSAEKSMFTKAMIGAALAEALGLFSILVAVLLWLK